MSEVLATTYTRSHNVLHAASSQLVICDVQEKLRPVIHDHDRLARGIETIASGATLWNIPVVATEQYPQGLGATIPTLDASIQRRVEKREFSAFPALGWPPAGQAADDRFQIVLCGIEAHICVLQTAFDLIAYGYQVFVPHDAVGSHRQVDGNLALKRLEGGGATIVSLESVLFEWCQSSTDPQFKAMSQLVKKWRGV